MTQHNKQNKQNRQNNMYLFVFIIIIGGLIYYFTRNKTNKTNKPTIINNMINNIESFNRNKPVRTKPFIKLG